MFCIVSVSSIFRRFDKNWKQWGLSFFKLPVPTHGTVKNLDSLIGSQCLAWRGLSWTKTMLTFLCNRNVWRLMPSAGFLDSKAPKSERQTHCYRQRSSLDYHVRRVGINIGRQAGTLFLTVTLFEMHGSRPSRPTIARHQAYNWKNTDFLVWKLPLANIHKNIHLEMPSFQLLLGAQVASIFDT